MIFKAFFFLVRSYSFKCYVGVDDYLVEQLCSECQNGVGCLCAKVPYFNGHTYRFCQVNPQDAIKEACGISDYYQGLTTDHCYCRTSLCNSAFTLRHNFTPMFTILLLFVVQYIT